MISFDEYIANYEKYEDVVAGITKKLATKQPLSEEEKEIRELEKKRIQEIKDFREGHPEGLYEMINK